MLARTIAKVPRHLSAKATFRGDDWLFHRPLGYHRGEALPLGMRRARARAKLVASAAGLLFGAWTSPAGAAPFALVWSAPDGCPSRERIVAATQANLGDEPSEASPELFVQGIVQQEASGFVIRLALKDASGAAMGEREVRVEGGRCSAIEEPTSLVLAMMIDVARPRLAARSAPQQPPPNAPPLGSKTAPRRPAPPPRPAPARASRFSLGVGGVASIGLFPVVGLGPVIRGMFSAGSVFVFGMEASFEFGGSIRAGGGEVAFQLLGASAFAGIEVFRREPFEMIVAVAGRGGLIRVSSAGFSEPQDDSRPIVLVGPGVIARARLAPRLFAEVFPQVEGVLIRDEFQLRSRGEYYPIHRPSVFEARLSLGLSYEFP